MPAFAAWSGRLAATACWPAPKQGHIQTFRLSGETLRSDVKIKLAPEGQPANPVPGGMAITRDGSRLFVAAANRNAVVEVDLAHNVRVREYPGPEPAVRAAG